MKASKAVKILESYEPDQEIYMIAWGSNIEEDDDECTTILSTPEWERVVKTLERWGVGEGEVIETIEDEVAIIVSQRVDGMIED